MLSILNRIKHAALRRLGLRADDHYIEELQTALAAARQTIADMSLVKRPPEPDGFFEASGVRLYRSSFNAAWLAEFGITLRIMIDVGSYDAGDAIRFKMLYPQARVIAFEADPNRASVVKENSAIIWR